ncbi:beta-1,3-galactosyltransferase 1-like [Nematolebias whitei]|uniref:beta-1,3-galactosyltransferase 1-like n=1 Tax=Nematolebias whitei TaxID=451745 RepID=UPI00189B5A54|nr:beta-1,3-galactosyltransferase 1-like [Nematolebias whitei]
MLERVAAKDRRSQEMVYNEQLGNKRWLSRRHCFFFILVLAAVLFFNCTNKKDMVLEWNPKQWIQNHSTNLFFPFVKQNVAINITDGPAAKASALSDIAGFTTEAASTALPQTLNISSTRELMIKNKTTVTIEMIQQGLHQLFPTPVPYVSPGLYLVEYPHEYHFTINEPQKCEQGKPFVVLMVPVAPRNRAHRDIIRRTWGSENLVLDQVVKLFFLLGMQTGEDAQQVHEQLLQESKEHQDLIQSDFVDCYKNLTIKTMVMLEWLNVHCSAASYAMKIDSDTFLNVPNLIKMLLHAPKTNYMSGLVAYGGAVLRDPQSKWYVPYEILPESVYPPYALGLGYILSLDLTAKLIEASRHVKALYIEDAYLGLCMRHLGIPPTNPPDYAYFNVFPVAYSPCGYSKIIVTTTDSSIDRVWLWTNYKRQVEYC